MSLINLRKFLEKDVSRFTPEELNQLEADEGVRFNREALKTSRGAIPQAGRQARPYARTVGVDPDAGLSTHAYGADEAVGPMGERRYTGKGMRAEFPSWAQDYGPTPQEWNAISQPDTPEERWSREKRIGMMSRFPQVPPNDGPDNPDDEERSDSYSPAEWARNNPRKAVQKLQHFAQLQKIGYPDPQQPYPKGFNMNQSAGLPEPESKEGQRIGEIAQKVDPYRFNEGGSPLHAAHSYIRRLQEDTSGKDLNFGDHLEGHDAIANVHNIMHFGEEYAHHPDAIKYKLEEPDFFGGDEGYWGYAEDADLNTPMSLELFHGRFVNNNIHPDTSHKSVGMADQLHQRLRQVSPDRLHGSVGSDLLRRNPRFPQNAESSDRLFRQHQYPGSMTPSYYESYPLPPTGEQEGKLGPGERTITYRWYDRDDEDLPPEARSKRKRDMFEYQSARARQASRKFPEDEAEEENISPPPSKAKDAFERRFPDLYDKEKAVSKLMKFVQIQKIGYPDPEREYPKGFKGDESSGIPSHGSKEWDALNELWDKLLVQGVVRKEFPLDLAHRYLRAIQLDKEGNQISIMNHIAGHQALADVYNLRRFGERFDLHPDRLEYQFPDTSQPVTGEDGWTTLGDSLEKPPEGYMEMLDRPYNQGWNTPRSLEDFHRHIVPAILNPAIEDEQSNQALGMMDDLHRRLRQTSPGYAPGDATFPKLQSPRHALQFGPRSSYGTETTPLPGSQQARDRENDLAIYEQTGKWPPGADSSAGRLYTRYSPDGRREPYDRDVHSVTGHRTEPPWKTEDKPAYDYGSHILPQRGEDGGYGPDYLGEGDTLPDERRTDYKSPQDRRNFRFPQSEPQYYRDKAQPSAPKSKAQNAFEQRFPDLFRDKEKAVAKLMKFMRKEGAGGGDGGGEGGAFNGLNGTVFTSTNAGIFTPTYGGQKTKRKHSKRHKAQEKKRKKLLGKEKKSGVDRLVQFLYDGSPMSKSRKPNKDMTGNAATAHAWNNKSTGRKILDWQKKAEDNQPNANMGQAGGMETGTTATYPRHENINSVGNGTTQRAPDWGKHQSYLQKLSSDGSVTMVSPTENRPAIGKHPQQGFVERTKDNPNEPPAKDAVVKENDMEKRIKSYDNKDEDTGHEQPRGAGAVAGLGGYPSGATMQMAMTSGGINPDALERGGEKDIEDPEVTEEETPGYWVPEAEKRLTAMKKELEEAGDENPILNALLKVDYA